MGMKDAWKIGIKEIERDELTASPVERRVMATANFTQEDIERLLKRAEYQIESNRLVYWIIGFATAAILLLPLVIDIKNVKP